MHQSGRRPTPQDEPHWYTTHNNCVFLQTENVRDVQAKTTIIACSHSQEEAGAATTALNGPAPSNSPS